MATTSPCPDQNMEGKSPSLEGSTKPAHSRIRRGELRRKRIDEARERGEPIFKRRSNKDGIDHGGRKRRSSTRKYTEPAPLAKQILTSWCGATGNLTHTPSEYDKIITKRARIESKSNPCCGKYFITHEKYPATQLPFEEEANLVRAEIALRANNSEGVQILSRIERGGMLMICVNEESKHWLENVFPDISDAVKIPLKMDAVQKYTKVFIWIPKTTEALDKDTALMGLKNQSGLHTDRWEIVGVKSSEDGLNLVVNVDEDSFQMLEQDFKMKPYLGGERVVCKHVGADHES